MATGETKITGLTLDVDPTQADLAVTVDNETGTNKKVPLGEISKALDKTKLLSTDADNLLTTGTDDNLRLDVDNDIVSADAGNILQKGTDGKLLAPSVALSLTENRMFIGGASNTPEEKTNLEVRSFLGLPTDYKNVSVVRDSGTQVTVQGKCRSEQDDIDLELSSATPVALLAPSANTRYNLFFAKVDAVSPTVALFSTASAPAGYAHFRKILTIPTDSLSSLSDFKYYSNKDKIEITLWSGSLNSGTLNLSDSIINYENIFAIGYNGSDTNAVISNQFLSSSLSVGNKIFIDLTSNQYIRFIISSNDVLTINESVSMTATKIIGVI